MRQPCTAVLHFPAPLPLSFLLLSFLLMHMQNSFLTHIQQSRRAQDMLGLIDRRRRFEQEAVRALTLSRRAARPGRQNNGIEIPNLIMWLGVSHPICISQGHAHVALARIWCFCIYLFPQALAKQKGSYALQLAWANNRFELKSRPLYAPWWTSLLYACKGTRFAASELWNVKVARRRNCFSQQELCESS